MAAIVRDEPAPLDAPVEASPRSSPAASAKLPAERFQTMSEVRAALQQAIEQAASKLAESIPSIAVLPFANMSGDKENEYFSDGLAEEILNVLAQDSGPEGNRPHFCVCVPGQGAGHPQDRRDARRAATFWKAACAAPATASASPRS